jgi:asparagine synthetase B (glutamine-hydrolysing)
VIARDPIGVCPLYWGHDGDGRLWVASEMKALVRVCEDVSAFPPGHYYDSAVGELVRYYDRPWRDYAATEGVAVAPQQLRDALESAVHRQLMSDVPYGVLLSGGLDSSLIAACAARSPAAGSRTTTIRSLVAAPAFVRDRPARLARPRRRRDRARSARHRAPRLHLSPSRKASTPCRK